MEQAQIVTDDDVPNLLSIPRPRADSAPQTIQRVVITDIQIGFWRTVSLLVSLCCAVCVAYLAGVLLQAMILKIFS